MTTITRPTLGQIMSGRMETTMDTATNTPTRSVEIALSTYRNETLERLNRAREEYRDTGHPGALATMVAAEQSLAAVQKITAEDVVRLHERHA